jgi:ABC-type transport system substrate-binding protein
MDSAFRPEPQMVDTWTVSDDKLTYTFTLRDALKFHDEPRHPRHLSSRKSDVPSSSIGSSRQPARCE